VSAGSGSIEAQLILELYEKQFPQLAAPVRLFLDGGRGTGKTTMLAKLRANARESTLIEGGSGDAGATQLYVAVQKTTDSAGARLSVFIDDVDRLVSLAHFRGEATLSRILESLLSLSSHSPGSDARFVVTSTLSPHRLSSVFRELQTAKIEDKLKLMLFSSFLGKLEVVHLNPWPKGWERTLENVVERHLASKLPGDSVESCKRELLNLTGGHPSLFVAALGEVMAIAAADPDDNRLDAGRPKLLVHFLEDHLIRTGLQPLRRAISSLGTVYGAEGHRALAYLRRIALGEEFFLPAQVREILQDEGLAYADLETGRIVVPGSLLRVEIEHSDPGPQVTTVSSSVAATARTPGRRQPVELWLEPDPQEPDARGYLAVSSGLERERIAFSGGPWTILSRLIADPERVFSLADLKRPPLRTTAAVRSAIQRLGERLRREGIDDALTNVHGQGYRLGGAPSRSIRAFASR
jgi:hypothetical protein